MNTKILKTIRTIIKDKVEGVGHSHRPSEGFLRILVIASLVRVPRSTWVKVPPRGDGATTHARGSPTDLNSRPAAHQRTATPGDATRRSLRVFSSLSAALP